MTNDLCGCRIVHQDKVDKAKNTALPPDRVEELVRFFKVLGDPGRVRILHALHDQEMCVCDLAAFLDVSESAVSHQLRLLRTSGLVTNRREGTVLYYSPVKDRCKEMMAQAGDLFG